MKIHYLEIVSLDVEAACRTFETAHQVAFGAADALLGGARTATLADGSLIGVRSPLRETEAPIVRPYWLVEDLESAVAEVETQGAKIAVPPMEIPGRGKFAIYLLGANDHGLWQI